MVSETTMKNEFKKAIAPFKSDKFKYVVNRGGYPIKTFYYDITFSDLEQIQSGLKHGSVGLETDSYGMPVRIHYSSADIYDCTYFEYPILFRPCDPSEITQVDQHHTYGTIMDTNDAFIEKILKQSDKAVYVQMVKPSGFRYERWLPKSTIYVIKREIDVNGVISKYTGLYESWQVIVLGNIMRHRTYGDEAHYKARIQNLLDEGCELVMEEDIHGVHIAYIYDEKEVRGIKGMAMYWGEEYVGNAEKLQIKSSVGVQKLHEYQMCWDIVVDKNLLTDEEMAEYKKWNELE